MPPGVFNMLVGLLRQYREEYGSLRTNEIRWFFVSLTYGASRPKIPRYYGELCLLLNEVERDDLKKAERAGGLAYLGKTNAVHVNATRGYKNFCAWVSERGGCDEELARCLLLIPAYVGWPLSASTGVGNSGWPWIPLLSLLGLALGGHRECGGPSSAPSIDGRAAPRSASTESRRAADAAIEIAAQPEAMPADASTARSPALSAGTAVPATANNAAPDEAESVSDERRLTAFQPTTKDGAAVTSGDARPWFAQFASASSRASAGAKEHQPTGRAYQFAWAKNCSALGGPDAEWTYTCEQPRNSFSAGETIQLLAKFQNLWRDHRFYIKAFRDGLFQWDYTTGWNRVGFGWKQAFFFPEVKNPGPGAWRFDLSIDDGQGFEAVAMRSIAVTGPNYEFIGAETCATLKNADATATCEAPRDRFVPGETVYLLAKFQNIWRDYLLRLDVYRNDSLERSEATDWNQVGAGRKEVLFLQKVEDVSPGIWRLELSIDVGFGFEPVIVKTIGVDEASAAPLPPDSAE